MFYANNVEDFVKLHTWEDKMEETISLQELFQILKKRFYLILICILIAATIGAVMSYFVITPVYQASTQLLVNQSDSEQNTYTSGEVQTNLQLINTYNVIVKSPVILEIVIKELNLQMTPSELSGKITVESEQNSQVINLTVQDPNPFVASQIVNKTAQVFEKEIVEIMNIDNVSVLAEATVTDGQAPIKPQPMLNIAIALVLGLMIGVGMVFLLEYLDNTLKTEEDIERTLDLPVIGAIQRMESSQAKPKHRLSRKKVSLRGETVDS